MEKERAIEIAQEYIDSASNKIQAKLNGKCQFLDEWTTDAFLNQVHHPVWVVFADNLNTGPFIDGVSEYSIVVSTLSEKVEDCRLT